MAELGIEQLEQALCGLSGRRVLVLGASYREDVKELAFSTVYPIVELLQRSGAHVLLHDPLFAPAELAHLETEVVDLSSERARSADAVVVQAMHADFKNLDWRTFPKLRAVLDGRGTLDPARIREAGAAYIAIGISATGAAAPK